MNDEYIKEINEYQDILSLQIDREYNGDCAISEKESVYNDINDYNYDKFDGWYTKDFVQYIQYLEQLTGITNTLGIKKASDDNV